MIDDNESILQSFIDKQQPLIIRHLVHFVPNGSSASHWRTTNWLRAEQIIKDLSQ